MTVWLPPLIKPDGRSSRIRLSGFPLRLASLGQLVGLAGCCSPWAWKRSESGQRLYFPEDFRVSPQPLPQPMSNEVIHLPEAAVVMGQSKVVAPATGHLVDFPHDRALLFHVVQFVVLVRVPGPAAPASAAGARLQVCTYCVAFLDCCQRKKNPRTQSRFAALNYSGLVFR